MEAFVRLQPTDEEEEEEEEKVKHNTSKNKSTWKITPQSTITKILISFCLFLKTQLFAGRVPSIECIYFTLCKINNNNIK